MPSRTWRAALLAAILGLVAALLPAPAMAEPECGFNALTGEMTITAEAGSLTLLFVGENNEILVNMAPCHALGTEELAKTNNVDHVNFVGTAGDDTFLIDMSAAFYAPGLNLEGETGQPEIEFVVNLGEGTDTLQVDGGPTDNKLHAGSAGINLNGDDDADVTFVGGADRLVLRGEIGKDEVTATGDPVTGLPVVVPVVLRGGPAADLMKGGPFDDFIIGEGGHDWLVGGAGDDVFRGMWGDDTLSYSSSALPMNIDLTQSTATGEGTDVTGLIETVKGSSMDDTVISSRFGGTVYAGPGNDRVFGADNIDRLFGGDGKDLLSGDQRRDHLDGGAGADRLTGGPYVDQLHGGDGKDRCRIDNNTDDKFSCEGRIARSTSASGRIHVIMANLKEMDASNHDHITHDPHKDIAQKGELVNFADRLAGELHVVPDVLLFSEAIGVSTRATAKLLTKEFGVRFGTAIAPTDLYVGNSSRRANKRNTSVVINMKTMERVNQGGYVTVRQPQGEQAEGTLPTSQDEAHVLLREKASGARVAVMSVHLLSSRKFRSRAIARQRKGIWAENLMSFFRDKYPDAPIKILGGEFNERRCLAHLETLECDSDRPNSPTGTTPLWRAITGDPFNYKDSVYEYNSRGPWDLWKAANKLEGKKGGKRIDFIFGKPEVYSGWHDQAYNARIFTRNYISDHRFISSVVGLPEEG